MNTASAHRDESSGDGQPLYSRLATIWQTRHRAGLHDVLNWTATPAEDIQVALTYVPTSAGFCGHDQLCQFAAAHPADKHFFHSAVLSRFSNRLDVLHLCVDEKNASVTEELLLTALHHERCDWLLPNLDGSRMTFQIPMVITAKYCKQSLATNGSLVLESVRVHWEHASLLKQIGYFERVLRSVARAGTRGEAVEEALETIPIMDGPKIALRILNPTKYNCNLAAPLPAISVVPVKTSEPSSAKPAPVLSRNVSNTNQESNSQTSIKNNPLVATAEAPEMPNNVQRKPVGGLTSYTLSSLLADLPEKPPKTPRANPAKINRNIFFADEDELAGKKHPGEMSSPNNSPDLRMAYRAPMARSGLVLGTEPDEECARTTTACLPVRLQNPMGTFFDEAQPHRPSISIDPKRNLSVVFNPDSGVPTYKNTVSLDPSRFTSKILGNSAGNGHGQNGNGQSSSGDDYAGVEETFKPTFTEYDNKRFESHIFDVEGPAATGPYTVRGSVAGSAAATAGRFESHMVSPDDDTAAPIDDANTQHRQQMRIDPHRMSSHMTGSSFSWNPETPDDEAEHYRMQRRQDSRSNSSQIKLNGEYDSISSTKGAGQVNARAYHHNVSQITFDFDQPESSAAAAQHQPTSNARRSLQPPGGYSTLVL